MVKGAVGQQLRAGDAWYLVSQKWWDGWSAFSGYGPHNRLCEGCMVKRPSFGLPCWPARWCSPCGKKHGGAVRSMLAFCKTIAGLSDDIGVTRPYNIFKTVLRMLYCAPVLVLYTVQLILQDYV